MLTAFLAASLSASSSPKWVDSFAGHSVSGWYRNSGPFHQIALFVRPLAFVPLDGKSAGFCFPGQ